jgi:trehalose-6-phosphatase
MQSANISWPMFVGDDRTDDNAYRLLCRTKHNNKEAYKEHGSSTIMTNKNRVLGSRE